jgi:3-methyl-2-oxobutanoate hydroxymethyltransferase
LVKEGGAHAVKLEGGRRSVAAIEAIIGAGIPVMGHVGLTPQTATALGGRRAQGRTAERALALAAQARAVEAAGAFAIVIEAIPAAVTAAITPLLEIPVIGIGAGADTDGQVLVLHDLLGIFPGRAPRFARQYVELRPLVEGAVADYAADVRAGRFPAPEHTFSIDPGELEEFLAGLADAT